MANSFVSYTADGVATQFVVTFNYLLKSHVKVYIDGVEDTTFTWPDSSTVQPTTTPANGEVVLIQRTTPLASLFTTFTDGSTLTAEDLNNAQSQALYAAQEREDLSGMEVDTADDTYDAASKIIKNVAAPTSANHAVNRGYVDGIQVAAGNVPTPENPADDDKVLEANAGSFAWTDKSVTISQISDAGSVGAAILADTSAAAVRAEIGVSEEIPGEIRMYGGTSAPTGWLFCDGSAVSRTTYSALFAIVSTTFGVGDGSTTFNLPDMRGRFPMGVGQGNTAEGGGAGTTRTLGDQLGKEDHTLTTAQLPSHSHGSGTLANSSHSGHSHSLANGQFADADGTLNTKANSAYGSALNTSTAGAHGHTISGSTAAAGSGNAHTITSPGLAVNFIIKT